MVSERTDTALKYEGMKILLESLGEVDAERFISLMNREPFNYTTWRQSHLEQEDVRTLSRKAMRFTEKGA